MDKWRRQFLAILAIPLVLVLCIPGLAVAEDDDGYVSAKMLDGKRIGVQTGSTFDQITLDNLPNAKISYYNSYPDMAQALASNKIDAFPGDEPVIRMIVAETSGLAVLEDSLDNFEFGVVLPKTKEGERLQKEFNEWIEQMRDSGELYVLSSKWVEGSEDEKTTPDYHAFPAPNGVLTMATDGAYPPMNYFRDGEVVGLDVDLAARFCESHGYGLNVNIISFDGILPAVQAGKVDFAISGITITEERAESVNFSVPYYEGGTVMAVRKSDLAGTTADVDEEQPSFWEGIVESFSKTFLREDRWKLFVEGVAVTLSITVLSILLGTALGFLVFVLCRNGGSVANAISGFCMWLVQGMPVVVLLMILYYIVFGSISIGGIAVSVVAFTLTFGTSVFSLLRMGVNAVDAGQQEAAFAMGYSDRQTFFKIILPQALPHVMTAFKGEIVSLIKATAVVGYIAVQDLTKMGDIVRSRTYEAFFPLIAVTVIYFLLEGLFGLVADRVKTAVNPKRRTRDNILKGVKTDD